MNLGCMEVERKRLVHAVNAGQAQRGGRRQRYALVGRAKQHVKLQAAVDDGMRVAACQAINGPSCGKQAGVEKIRALTPRFQGEVSKAQRLALNAQLQKLFCPRLDHACILGEPGSWVTFCTACRQAVPQSVLHDPSDWPTILSEIGSAHV